MVLMKQGGGVLFPRILPRDGQTSGNNSAKKLAVGCQKRNYKDALFRGDGTGEWLSAL